MQLPLDKAIELRQKFPFIEEYKSHCKSTHAYVFDGWLGMDNIAKDNVSQKPQRPANYKLLPQHWELVEVEKAFIGYPVDKINDLIEKEEFYYAFLPE